MANQRRNLTISPLLLILFLSLIVHTCSARLLLAASHAERVHHHSSKGREGESVRIHSNTIMKLLRKEDQGSRRKMGKSLSVVQNRSLTAVSRRSSRGKHGPGFHLDYSPPLTHPPIHN
ncbi:hypothetical protein AMTR_s00010p00068530 [Amborella trichopoda]|uniref:Uncharacterized protein n=1 Tax=Amborella trichopoda TaxID=13333 RepID=W1NFV2_AMBTC|nr:hypothetical protein AMTR_s00010p00068530 [Amborella trichopoda]